MKFSCLIANYNNGTFLEEAIDSVLNQNLQDFEIIIVDDGSTDNSSEVYNRYGENEKVKILYNDVNRGCGYTKNRCLQEAKGEFIGFLDPDDMLLPTALEDMVAALENSNYVAAYSSFAWHKDYSSGNFHVHCKTKQEGLSHFEHHYLAHFFVFKNPIGTKLTIDASLKRAVDQDLYLKVEELGDIVHVPKLHYLYRATPNSISLNSNEHKATYWEFKVHEAACTRRGIEPENHFSDWFTRKIDVFKRPYWFVRNSKEYKLGFKILHPKQWLKI